MTACKRLGWICAAAGFVTGIFIFAVVTDLHAETLDYKMINVMYYPLEIFV